MTLTTEQLAQALKDAAIAHHEYETALGHPDANWQAWYAAWIADRYPEHGHVADCLSCGQGIAIAWQPLPPTVPLDAPVEWSDVVPFHERAHDLSSELSDARANLADRLTATFGGSL